MRPKKEDNGLRLFRVATDCRRCSSSNRCLGGRLSIEEQALFSNTIRHTACESGKKIYKAEQKTGSLYAIYSGAVKVQAYAYDGTNLISGFYFPGDLVGIESIGDPLYRSDAIALTQTIVCEIPFDRLKELFDPIPSLQHEVVMLFAKKIRNTESTFIFDRHMHAEARLLLFLRHIGEYIGIRRPDGSLRLHLPMTKSDVACYLDIRPESLSRTLKKLESKGAIRNYKRCLDLLEIEKHIAIICGEIDSNSNLRKISILDCR